MLMAKIFGAPSRYLLIRERISVAAAISYGVVIVVFALLGARSNGNYLSKPGSSILAVLLASTLFFIPFYFGSKLLLKENVESKKFRKGRKAEAEAFEALKKLPDTFSIFYNIHPDGRADNVDFAVVGPTGVYAIEVKSHSGRIGYDGKEITLDGHSFLDKELPRQAFDGAIRIHDAIKKRCNWDIFVTPVLVFTSRWARLELESREVGDTFVLLKDQVYGFFGTHKRHTLMANRDAIENCLSGLVARSGN